MFYRIVEFIFQFLVKKHKTEDSTLRYIIQGISCMATFSAIFLYFVRVQNMFQNREALVCFGVCVVIYSVFIYLIITKESFRSGKNALFIILFELPLWLVVIPVSLNHFKGKSSQSKTNRLDVQKQEIDSLENSYLNSVETSVIYFATVDFAEKKPDGTTKIIYSYKICNQRFTSEVIENEDDLDVEEDLEVEDELWILIDTTTFTSTLDIGFYSDVELESSNVIENEKKLCHALERQQERDK